MWGASSTGVRPSVARAKVSDKAKRLQAAVDQSVPMTERERQAKIDARRAAAEAAVNKVAVAAAADAVGRGLADLQAVYHRFLAEPSALSVGALESALMPPRDRDVGWHLLAHQVLCYAASTGIFGDETTKEMDARREAWYTRTYLPVLGVLKPCDHAVVAELIRNAELRGLLHIRHVTSALTGLQLHGTFYAALLDIHRRLAGLEKNVTNAGELLFKTMQNLHGLQQRLVGQEEHARKVALAKSAVKIGVSLVPVVGGLLGVSVDVVGVLVDGSSEATALLTRTLVDPTDLSAARQVLTLVHDAEANLTREQMIELRAVVHPYESVAEVQKSIVAAQEQLAEAATLPELATDAEVEGVHDAVGDMAGGGDGGGERGCECAEAASDGESGKLDDLKDAIKDAVIEHRVDAAYAQPAVQPDAPPLTPAGVPPPGVSTAGRPAGDAAGATPPPRPALPSTGATSGATPAIPPPPLRAGRVVAPVAAAPPASTPDAAAAPPRTTAAAPRPPDAAFFADAADWTVAETADRLVAYVARRYDAPAREELAAIVRTAAAEHYVTGQSIVDSQRHRDLAVCLLGEWGTRQGVLMSVERFIDKAKRFAVQP